MEKRDANAVLHLPKDMAYTCHSTGVCCNVFDNIPVDAAAADALARLDPVALNRLAGNSDDMVVTSTPLSSPASATPSENTTPEVSVARKACGSCVMLTPDNLCAIHALADEAAKPRACQDFPWRYVETPGGVYVGLSFVCPSVRANRGQLVQEQSVDLQVRYQTSASVRSAPELIPLNPRRSLTWDNYLHLESALTDLLALPHESLSVRLIACSLLPGFIDQMLAQPATDLPTVIAALRAAEYRHILGLARKARKASDSHRPRRMFLGMFTSFANTLHRRKGQGRISTVAGVLNQYLRAAAGIGRITLEPIKKPVVHAQLDNAHLPEDGEVASQITRYITHCIIRKDLTLSGDINRRMRMLSLNAALIAWYATALANADQPQEADRQNTDKNNVIVSAGNWDEAISLVERLYGFHSVFYQFFERNRTFSDIVDSFILKPSFPYTLLRQGII